MIDGIGTDSPKLVKSAGRNGSASKLESWAEAINRVTAASLLDETRQKVRDTFAAFFRGRRWNRISPFATTYGNHDFQCGILADEQDDLYREFAGCMNPVAGSSPLALEPGHVRVADRSVRRFGAYHNERDAGQFGAITPTRQTRVTATDGSRSPNTRNTRRIRAAGIWPTPTATAPPRRQPSNG